MGIFTFVSEGENTELVVDEDDAFPKLKCIGGVDLLASDDGLSKLNTIGGVPS